MKLIRRYLATEVITATLFVFAALISLYTLLDMIRELKDFGQGNPTNEHLKNFINAVKSEVLLNCPVELG